MSIVKGSYSIEIGRGYLQKPIELQKYFRGLQVKMCPGPLNLKVTCYLPISHLLPPERKDRLNKGKVKHIEEPSLFPILETIKSCLKGVLFENEEHIHKATISKIYAFQPRIVVQLTSTENK